MTHAFFKGCLFLGAGSVIHAMHARIHDTDASQDMRNMGGLRQFMPHTYWTFGISCLAIAGLPFVTSGFFSKDEILFRAYTTSVQPPVPDGKLGDFQMWLWPASAGKVLFALGVLGAVMTAFYMFRLFFRVFWGEFKGWTIVRNWTSPAHDAHDDHHHAAADPIEGPKPHESAPQMTVPLMVLAVLAVVAGFLNAHPFGIHVFDKWLEPVFAGAADSIVMLEGAREKLMWPLLVPGALAFVVGVGAAYWIYVMQAGRPAEELAAKMPGLHRWALAKWKVDELYEETFIGAVDSLGEFAIWFDKWVVDGIIARLSAFLVAAVGTVLRMFQTGRVQAYGAVMVVGVAGLGWFFASPHAQASIERDDNSGQYTITAAPGLGYEYRWDANGDGELDGEAWSGQQSVQLQLGIDEERTVKLAVKNAFGRVTTKDISIKRQRKDLLRAPHRSGAAAAPDRGAERRRPGAARRGGRQSAEAGPRPGAAAMNGIVETVPYLLAFIAAAAIPRRQGWAERIALGVVGALSVAFVSGLWPSEQDASKAAEWTPAGEWPHLLNVIIFVPIFGAVATLFLPRQAPNLLRRFTLLVLALDFLASLWLLGTPMAKGWHFQYATDWLPSFGIRYHVAVDGISLWLILLTTVTTPDRRLCLLRLDSKREPRSCASPSCCCRRRHDRGVRRPRPVPVLRVLGADADSDVLDDRHLGRRREDQGGGTSSCIFTMAGSGADAGRHRLHGVDQPRAHRRWTTFDYLALSSLVLPGQDRRRARCASAAFSIAFFIKVPMFPVHTWLPDAHVQAPTGGSVILAAVMLKLGTYAYMRFCDGHVPRGRRWDAAATLAGVAVMGGIIYGALCAWKQRDVKRLVAYSSVAHHGLRDARTVRRDHRAASRGRS